MDAQITILPGDGIGPEVASAGKDVMMAVQNLFGHNFTFENKYIGGSAIDKFNNPLPNDTKDSCKDSAAVILGAVGGPKWDDPNANIRPEQGLLGLRELLSVFANIRPVKIFPSLTKTSPLKEDRLNNVDLIVIRELTGGIYFGEKTRNENKSSDLCVYHDYEIKRIIRIAADIAKKRKCKLCSVDKANVLETSRFWRDITKNTISAEYPEIIIEHILVDAAAMYLINRPSDFDVIVTENMFGDILTDEASMLTGSLGMLPSASLSDTSVGLYEPIHGSAPDIAGKGIANPIAQILSAALMLRYSLKQEEAARAIEKAVAETVKAGIGTQDIYPNERYTTSDVAAAIVDRI